MGGGLGCLAHASDQAEGIELHGQVLGWSSCPLECQNSHQASSESEQKRPVPPLGQAFNSQPHTVSPAIGTVSMSGTQSAQHMAGNWSLCTVLPGGTVGPPEGQTPPSHHVQERKGTEVASCCYPPLPNSGVCFSYARTTAPP